MTSLGGLTLLMLATAPLNAEITATSGTPVQLKARWGRPTVLFYEDRYSTGLNQVLKDELIERGRSAGLLTKVSVIAVANLSAYNWFPAKQFALSAVKEAEQAAGVPVYIDWSGTLARTPWNLSPTTSTVLVIDERGVEVWRGTGTLTPAQRQQVFSEIERLLGSA